MSEFSASTISGNLLWAPSACVRSLSAQGSGQNPLPALPSAPIPKDPLIRTHLFSPKCSTELRHSHPHLNEYLYKYTLMLVHTGTHTLIHPSTLMLVPTCALTLHSHMAGHSRMRTGSVSKKTETVTRECERKGQRRNKDQAGGETEKCGCYRRSALSLRLAPSLRSWRPPQGKAREGGVPRAWHREEGGHAGVMTCPGTAVSRAENWV